MANRTRLTLVIEGLEGDGKDVDFRVFTAKLEAVRAALRHAETNEDRNTRYRVVDLRHDSPATLVLEATEPGPTQRLITTISGIRSSQDVVGDWMELLFDDVRDLTKGISDQFTRIRLFSDDHAASIDPELDNAIRDFERRDLRAHGSLKGAVERFNSHDTAHYFYIYPRLGRGVKCIFPSELLQQAAAAVERNTTVMGLMKFRKGQFQPYECEVRSIEIHPDDSELPSLSGLMGAVPDLTGQESTLEFLRRIRSDWQN